MRNEAVAKYSEEMTEIASKYTTRCDYRVYKFFRDGIQKEYLIGRPIGRPAWLVAFPVSLASLFFMPVNAVFFASGLIAGAAKQILDVSSSSKAFKEFEDKRFFEYGLDEYFEEGNRFFSRHPTEREHLKKSLLLSLGVIAITTLVPPFGYSLCADAPFLYVNNYKRAKEIKTSKKIGDKIKEKLEKGESDTEIEKFLDELCKNPKLIRKL